MANTYYFTSAQVKVYPTARRGSYQLEDTTNTYTYDPEARLETEYNKVNHFSKTVAKSSYLISWENSLLKCVVGGYYFEINVDGPNEIINKFSVSPQNIYLVINTEEIKLINNNVDERNSYLLKVLNTEVVDDSRLDYNNYFYGLAYTDNPEGLTNNSDNVLQMLIKDENGEYIINPEAYLIESLLLTGAGYHSIVAQDDKNGSNLANSSKGKYSITLGTKNQNKGDFGLIYGDTNSSEGNNNIIIGKNNEASTHENVILIGSGIEADKDNKVVISGYADLNFNNLINFIDGKLEIKNKETNGNTHIFKLIGNDNSNIVTISKSGNITSVGNLTINGTGNSSIGGKLTIGNGSDGNGLEVNGTANISSTLEVTGSTTLKSGVTINGATALTDSLAVRGNVSINNDTITMNATTGDVSLNNLTFSGTLSNSNGNIYLGTVDTKLFGVTISPAALMLDAQQIVFRDNAAVIKYVNGGLEITC